MTVAADLSFKATSATRELGPARKRQIVGIPRVRRSRRGCQRGESAVEPIGAQVGDRGRGRRSLRQVRLFIQPARLATLYGIAASFAAVPHIRGSRVAAKASQRVRHRFRIADGSKQRLHSRRRDRWKEVLQIDLQHRRLPDVRDGKRLDRPAAPKPVRRLVERNWLQQFSQNSALNCFESRLGRLNQSDLSKSLRLDPVVIVTQRPELRFASQERTSANQASSRRLTPSHAASSLMLPIDGKTQAAAGVVGRIAGPSVVQSTMRSGPFARAALNPGSPSKNVASAARRGLVRVP